MLALVALAFAAPNQLFPWSAPVVLPPGGASRIEVPLALRTVEDPVDGSDLQLVDADGEVVPFAVRRGDLGLERVLGVEGRPDGNAELEWWPGLGDWQIEVRHRPLDALVILLPSSPGAAKVVIEESTPAGWAPVADQLVWRLLDGASAPIPMPPRTGRFRALITPSAGDLSGGVRIDGERGDRGPGDQSLELPVDHVQVMENGWVRYDVTLPRPLPVSHVELMPTDALFDRQASAGPPTHLEAPDEVPPVHTPWDSRPIRRLSLAGTRLESVRVPVGSSLFGLHGPTDRLHVWVEAQGRPPLDIPSVRVIVPRVELLVLDPGPGPFTLLAGADPGTNGGSDLQMAGVELDRSASDPITPGPAGPNPGYRAPEDRGGLMEPGAILDPGRFAVAWPIEGPVGLVRLPLPSEVLTLARPDLADLRVVDGQRRQLPYLLRSDGVQHDLGVLPMKRTERGTTSVIEVTLPTSNLLIGTVTLRTDAPLFHRQVRVSRPDRGRLAPLRAFDWSGGDRPVSVSLDVNQRLGDTLVIEIENGDDPPLPLTSVEATWPGWEILVRNSGDASLWAGDPRASRPDHDLFLVDDLGDRVQGVASLGARASLSPLPVSLFDRALVLFGVAVMALGLLALTVALVRDVLRGPPAPPAADPPADPPAPAEEPVGVAPEPAVG